ncbi:hypothetical protein H5T51_06065 [Candidatus Bathyarchaeota archaeon]|nr:hypothetical protein [Candidatus Bathyarchaeota archaeon]
MLRRVVLFITLLTLALLFPRAIAYSVDTVTVEVYRDGVVTVQMNLSVNETEPLVDVELLSPSAYNILALDEAGEILNYDLDVSTLTIYTLGASEVTLEYDAEDLTSKSGGIWTITFTSIYDIVLLLPENSTVIYFNNAPASIGSEGAKVRLELPPGSWEISYILGAAPPTSTPTTPPSQPSPSPEWLNYLPYIAGAVITVIAVVLSFKFFRRKRTFETLRMEEAEVIKFLKEHGGKALEAELREAFPDIPKTSMWRLVKRLEKRGILTVRKVGLQNVVELK